MTATIEQLTGVDALHLAIAKTMRWGWSERAGEWWTDGYSAMKVFPGSEGGARLETACGCDGYWVFTPTTVTAPECCELSLEGEYGVDGGCRAFVPSECRHAGYVWSGGQPEAMARALTRLRAPDERAVPLTLADAPETTEGFVDYAWRLNGPDGRWLYTTAVCVKALREYVEPDAWEAINQVAHRGRRKVKDAASIWAYKNGVIVGMTMPLLVDTGVWCDDAEKVEAYWAQLHNGKRSPYEGVW